MVTNRSGGVSKEMMKTLELLAQEAVGGDAKALESLIARIKDDIYGLALRMLWRPADAEDATQEVLIRIVTYLSTFDGRSTFKVWAYRVAVNRLLNFRRGRAEHRMSFEAFAEDLAQGLDAPAPGAMQPSEQEVLEQEVKIACTQAMLLCLDRAHRMAYLLGEIMGLSSQEAAECLEVTEATYRKRLSRARQRVHEFARAQCGIVNPQARCRCKKRLAPALAQGRVDPSALLFAKHPTVSVSSQEAEAVIVQIERIQSGGALMRSNPRYRAPDRLLEFLKRWEVGKHRSVHGQPAPGAREG